MRRQSQLLGALDIAGIACAVECGDDALAELLAARYAGFATTAGPALALRVEVADPPAAEVARFLDIAGKLMRTVPCYEMAFTPDRSFWGACPTGEPGGA